MGIFDRLGYNSEAVGNNVIEFSSNVISYMNTLPSLLSQWQIDDIANNDVGGYFKNPVANITNSIKSTCNSIISITGLSSSNINVVFTAANTLLNNVSISFTEHTNRISGVTGVTGNTADFPHFQTAIASGKLLSTLVFQSDGIQNNAPIIGNFTSLYTEEQLNTYYQTIVSYPTTIQGSIITITTTGETGPVTTYASNLTQETVNTMANNINAISSLMDNRRNGDVTFFNNSQDVIRDYKEIRQFSNMGQTQTDLIGLVGSDKLNERLNS